MSGRSPVTGQLPGRRGERVVVTALRRPRQRAEDIDDSLEELVALVDAAGGTVVGRVVQERERPNAALYFGRGKVAELGEMLRAQGAGLLVSDDTLSPVQERNLSRETAARVLDRTAVILDIFAQRARSREGMLQVELAQLEYLLPRLIGQWRHLERLGGGIGTRGPGETQLETDRRLVRGRLMHVRRELDGVRAHRALQRRGRERAGLPLVALVGYTNAGKTTLLNRLAGSSLQAAPRMFETLDPTSRLIRPPAGVPFILSDTVGFVRKLPTELVAAFRATLEELEGAELLLHVVDASHRAAEAQVEAVRATLTSLGLGSHRTLEVHNKVDRLPADLAPASRDGQVAVSAATGQGVEALHRAIDRVLAARRHRLRLRLPHTAAALVARCYAEGAVLAREDEADAAVLEAVLPAALARELARFRTGGDRGSGC